MPQAEPFVILQCESFGKKLGSKCAHLISRRCLLTTTMALARIATWRSVLFTGSSSKVVQHHAWQDPIGATAGRLI